MYYGKKPKPVQEEEVAATLTSFLDYHNDKETFIQRDGEEFLWRVEQIKPGLIIEERMTLPANFPGHLEGMLCIEL